MASSPRAWRTYEEDFDPYVDYPTSSSSSSLRASGSGLASSSIPHVPHETDRMLPVPASPPSTLLHASTVTSRQTYASDAPLIPVSLSEVGAGYGQSMPVSMRLLPRDKEASPSESNSSSSELPGDPGPSNPRRSLSSASFPSSPLHPGLLPGTPSSPSTPLPFARPLLPSNRSTSSIRVTRIASEDSRALSAYFPPASPLLGSMLNAQQQQHQRGSMILYRLADPLLLDDPHSPLSPPVFPGSLSAAASNRGSVISTADSVMSLSSDSKYPMGMTTNTERGIIAYAYDPNEDGKAPGDDEMDRLHDPNADTNRGVGGFGWRGVGNIGMLLVLISAILALFIVFPAVQVFNSSDAHAAIAANTRINATGQASDVGEVNPGFSTPPEEEEETPSSTPSLLPLPAPEEEEIPPATSTSTSPSTPTSTPTEEEEQDAGLSPPSLADEESIPAVARRSIWIRRTDSNW